MSTIAHVGKSQYHILNDIFQFLPPQPPWCAVSPSYCILRILKPLENSLCHTSHCASDSKQMLLGPSLMVSRAQETPRVHQNRDPCTPFLFKPRETSTKATPSPRGKTMGETTLQVRSALLWVLGWAGSPAPRAEEMGSAGLRPRHGKPHPIPPAARRRSEEPGASLFWALIIKSP